MQFIKLDAISSTNDYLKNRLSDPQLPDRVTVVAEQQTAGRGQQGNIWVSEPGKNLTFSILIKNIPVSTIANAAMSMRVSLMVYDTLKHFLLPDLAVKWPNDILSGNKKLAGILIENIINEEKTCHLIIGVGINVNQTDFGELHLASSMKTICGKSFDKEEVLAVFLKTFKKYYDALPNADAAVITKSYHEKLFRIDKPSTFEGKDGRRFSGIIRGVDAAGRLLLEVEDKRIIAYGHKEVNLLY